MALGEADLRFQIGISPTEAGVPEPVFSAGAADGMRIERNRSVALTDGTEIYVDVFRPEERQDVPVLLAWGPYGKHNGGGVYQLFSDESGTKGGGVRPEWISAYTGFEGPDPKGWCTQGYAVVNVDPRGTWWSGGDYASIWDEREARDCADVIAWAGAEPWSNGKVGMSGVSYLAVAQWWAASLRPPCLAAINPWEGLSDVYREFAFHGGIPSNFPAFWQANRLQYSRAKVEAIADMMAARPRLDAYWESKRPDLSRIEIPAYVVASWSDQGLHIRGTLDAFEQLSSEQKFLEVHGRKKWETYHAPSSVARQRQFFDHFLKDIDNGVEEWPAVRLEVRRRFYDGIERRPASWPPPETAHRELFLEAEHGRLAESAPSDAARVGYRADAEGEGVDFEHVFAEAVDVVGTMRLRLWLELAEGEDSDLFVGVKKRGRDGESIDFPYANVLEHGPTALGWLRVSHRELDAARSTVGRPWHTHAQELPVSAGEVVEVEVEIWPSGTRFEAGERLVLRLQGGDLYPGALLFRHVDTRGGGTVTVHTGADRPSSLTVPVLPVEAGAAAWASPDV